MTTIAVAIVRATGFAARRMAHSGSPSTAPIAKTVSVSAIVHGTHLGRDFGVAQRGVEIGYTVKRAVLPDPGIDRDPVHLARWIPGVGHVGLIAERCQRRANDLDAGCRRATPSVAGQQSCVRR